MDLFSVYNSGIRDEGINAEEIFGVTGAAMDQTLNYYAENADNFVADTVNVDYSLFCKSGTIPCKAFAGCIHPGFWQRIGTGYKGVSGPGISCDGN